MARIQREWAAAFLNAAADVTTTKRTIGKRTKMVWRHLPTKRGGLVLMQPHHGHVYQALILHTGTQDMDAEFVTSDASVRQLMEASYWGESQVGDLLNDLEAVGLIHRRRRANKSSIITVYREPGNFDGPVEVLTDSTHHKQENASTSPARVNATKGPAAQKEPRPEDVDLRLWQRR